MNSKIYFNVGDIIVEKNDDLSSVKEVKYKTEEHIILSNGRKDILYTNLEFGIVTLKYKLLCLYKDRK